MQKDTRILCIFLHPCILRKKNTCMLEPFLGFFVLIKRACTLVIFFAERSEGCTFERAFVFAITAAAADSGFRGTAPRVPSLTGIHNGSLP